VAVGALFSQALDGPFQSSPFMVRQQHWATSL